MPGNSQRKGAVRRSGKGNTAGSGGRIRRGLEGKGPTPKAEDRPYHTAYRAKKTSTERRPGRGAAPKTGRPGSGPEWVVGRNAVLEAMEAEIPIRSAYVAEGAERDDRLRSILKRAATRGTSLLEVSRSELDRLTGGALHQGVALTVPPYEYAHPDELLEIAAETPSPGLIVALDGVTDPRNLGAVVRSVGAFGGHGVVVPQRRSAGMTAVAWRTSAGVAARLPVARATNLTRTLREFATAGYMIAGLDAEGSVSLDEFDLAADPLVLVVGSEGKGLSRLVKETCDVTVSIPMAGPVESLNASVAAGVVLAEVARRRRQAR